MANETDEELAKKLQEEFDKEARQFENQHQSDYALAQKLAAKAHDVSDSESDEESPNNLSASTSNPNESVCLNIVSENKADVEHSSTPTKSSKRPMCKYGAKCYRKCPTHLEEFYHPSADDHAIKKQKTEQSSSKESYTKPFSERLKLSSPLNFFLNKNFSVPDTKLDWLTLVFPDLLHPRLGTLMESVQINFMVDLEFVMQFYKHYKLDKLPLLFMYGELVGNPKDHPAISCCKVNMPYQYGVHHSKMMLMLYKEGMRVVVHTANLIEDDWTEKTQGFWVSPLFPPLGEGVKSGLLEGESDTCFKRDITEYLLSYKNSQLNRWTNFIKAHDFSLCNVYFIGSVPGYHTGETRFHFGHLKCRQLMKKSKWKPGPGCPVIVQCSSIGSLGKDSRSWLTTELGVSLMGATPNSTSQVKLIYPTEEDVANSSQGYGGGSCLPYNSKTHEKQTWLKNHMHCWRSKSRFRTRAMPHIKSYTRLNTTNDKAQFFILTSSNLSKAAWGQLQKQDTQLFVRSYEAGVLWLPEHAVNADSFDLKSDDSQTLKLPYDLPLTPYPSNAVPWMKNTSKKTEDVFGTTYL